MLRLVPQSLCHALDPLSSGAHLTKLPWSTAAAFMRPAASGAACPACAEAARASWPPRIALRIRRTPEQKRAGPRVRHSSLAVQHAQ